MVDTLSQRIARMPPRLRAQYERKAAAKGMTLVQFAAFCDAESERLDAIRTLTNSRTAQRCAIASHAVKHGRTFEVRTVRS